MWAMMQKLRMIEGSVRPGGGANTGLTTPILTCKSEFGPLPTPLVAWSVASAQRRPRHHRGVPEACRGEYQVPAQANQDQREGSSAQQGDEVSTEDLDSSVPRRSRFWRYRQGHPAGVRRLPCPGQGCLEGDHS